MKPTIQIILLVVMVCAIAILIDWREGKKAKAFCDGFGGELIERNVCSSDTATIIVVGL